MFKERNICHSGKRQRIQNQSDAGPDFAEATYGKASKSDRRKGFLRPSSMESK
jgi:hypothetical protein